MSSLPETRYAKSGDTYIALQVMGDGPFDLVFVSGFISHVEMQLEQFHAAARILLSVDQVR